MDRLITTSGLKRKRDIWLEEQHYAAKLRASRKRSYVLVSSARTERSVVNNEDEISPLPSLAKTSLDRSILKLPTRGRFPFLRLPRELRDEVYKLIFAPISFNFLRLIRGRDALPYRKPRPNSLAILRVCRQVNEEADYVLYNQYIFGFFDASVMRSMFRSLPSSTLSRLRHICVGGTPIQSTLINGEPTNDFFAGLCAVDRPSLPLRLQTFTVIEIDADDVASKILLDLLEFGDCWKELRYFSPSAEKLGLSKTDISHASHKLESWNKIMLGRDGQNSGASVIVYEATDPVYKQTWESCSSKTIPTQGWKHEEALLVIARRGHHADISTEARSPFVFDGELVFSLTSYN
ncbi:hypothetical protein FQN50_002576 [Emmonsiellopsis sp. PD_5]|nr:hypothetical protein FQN50_002576 [Emmonsiellopsis sp. PD_5]